MKNPKLAERRWLSPPQEQKKVAGMLRRLKREMGTAATTTFMIRALLKVWANNEDEIFEALTAWEWARPENGDHKAVGAHVEELAELIEEAVRG